MATRTTVARSDEVGSEEQQALHNARGSCCNWLAVNSSEQPPDNRDGVEPPSVDVRRAFGVVGAPHRFESGEGKAFGVDELVLKPAASEREAEWIADAYEHVVENGFRVPQPVRAAGGSWVYDGWTAWHRVEGEPTNRRWEDIVQTGLRFHAAVRDLERPDFLDDRTHQWAVGDRVAFGESELMVADPLNALVERLQECVRPSDLPDQVIHGDLTGNVLFARGLAPAVIDFSPFYRPTGYATAIVAVDAIAWSRAPLSVIDLIEPAESRYELLARALIFRLVAAGLHYADDPNRLTAQAEAHRPLVERAIQELSGRQ
jgi:uncharacterized protein (TIGR02569 family)